MIHLPIGTFGTLHKNLFNALMPIHFYAMFSLPLGPPWLVVCSMLGSPGPG